jgi:hypothetical protein
MLLDTNCFHLFPLLSTNPTPKENKFSYHLPLFLGVKRRPEELHRVKATLILKAYYAKLMHY